jgi:hypothetical protein
VVGRIGSREGWAMLASRLDCVGVPVREAVGRRGEYMRCEQGTRAVDS